MTITIHLFLCFTDENVLPFWKDLTIRNYSVFILEPTVILRNFKIYIVSLIINSYGKLKPYLYTYIVYIIFFVLNLQKLVILFSLFIIKKKN